MILLENNVPPVYVDDSRDFQFFLRAYNVIFNMVKQDINTLQYITNTKECETRILPLLKTKLGFFTNYDMDNEMLRWILRGFPYLIKNKGSLLSIQQAVYVFLKALNIKTKVIIKATGNEDETLEGSINIGNHTILIAIESAVKNFYVLEEIFKYIMPIGYQYAFFFYKTLEEETWLLNESTGKFLIVNTEISDSIRTETFYNQELSYEYDDPEIDRLLNQFSLVDVYQPQESTSHEFIMKAITGEEPAWFKDYYYFIYKKEDGKFVQLKPGQDLTYVSGEFYIPIFFFINNENIFTKNTFMTDDGVTEDLYVLLESDPTFDYKGTEVSKLQWEYFNYYTKPETSGTVFKNLKEPVTWEAGKYYKVNDNFNKNKNSIKAVAKDVDSYAAIPITSEYIVAVTSLAQ